MDETSGVDIGAQGEGPVTRTREYRIGGLADLLPDWILPRQSKEHLRNARREVLLAMRSIIDAAIERNERGTRIRQTTRIEIE